MAVANPIKKALQQVMERHGFKLEKPPSNWQGAREQWVKELPEVIWFVGLVISKYGKKYGVSLGLHLKGVGHPFGKHRWLEHGNAGLSLSLRKTSVDEIRALLNLRHEMDEQERISRLIEIFKKIPRLFRGCETVDGAMKKILSKRTFVPDTPIVEEYLKRPKRRASQRTASTNSR
jgi:hypothetical protein